MFTGGRWRGDPERVPWTKMSETVDDIKDRGRKEESEGREKREGGMGAVTS